MIASTASPTRSAGSITPSVRMDATDTASTAPVSSRIWETGNFVMPRSSLCAGMTRKARRPSSAASGTMIQNASRQAPNMPNTPPTAGPIRVEMPPDAGDQREGAAPQRLGEDEAGSWRSSWRSAAPRQSPARRGRPASPPSRGEAADQRADAEAEGGQRQ